MIIKRWIQKEKSVIKIKKDNGGIQMAVSKATLGCVRGEIGTRLIADIQSTSINRDAIKKCESLLRKLAGKE